MKTQIVYSGVSSPWYTLFHSWIQGYNSYRDYLTKQNKNYLNLKSEWILTILLIFVNVPGYRNW